MLADNIKYLKKNYPEIYQAQQAFEADFNTPSIFLEDTKKSGIQTLKFCCDGQTVYLHSKYDPIREAVALIDKIADNEAIDEKSHIIFYGLGFGYHIEAFIKRFPNTAFTLYEPSAEVFAHFLDYRSLKKVTSKNLRDIICEYSMDTMIYYFSKILSNTDKRLIVVSLPVYEKVFSEQYALFFNNFKTYLREKRNEITVNYAFKQRWIINSVNNFNQVLSTPNILMQEHDEFKEKTAILVSAGPSLDYEIENLRYIKDNGLAFIFCVGSSINTLIHNGIYPDAMCTYDPTEENQIVFKKVIQLGIKEVPMIFGTSVGFEVLKQYEGPKFHMITSQDTVSGYLLKSKKETELKIVQDAPSIAVVTLELLNMLQFSQIVLVGQNLAYKGGKNYASGIDYYENGVAKITETLIETDDVYGNKIVTTHGMNRMKAQLESYIRKYEIPVINTTVEGANIEGAEFINLKTVIKDRLKSRIVTGEEFEKINKQRNTYDIDYLNQKLSQLHTEFDNYQKLIADSKMQLNKLAETIINNNVKLASVRHSELDAIIRRIEKNDFFNVIVLPLNRVEYEILANHIQRIKREKNDFLKAKQILKPTETFINHLSLSSDLNQKIMLVLNNNVMNCINERRA
ncbi:motility associated factor glycosyltransferase family protein [Acetobacterium wieringae]|uniref:motility associated factor glycosyltransferase family protein n=1 Tax=Acetobacterium wieringae TaxID=52694 RepID=UPI002B20AC49|nr:6-hydroxymethylpterin diphosphokinase MptE-like protein [Acetobacterium wieringae]MEA4804382.1 6-hydroxymethylpterin diphosphokinase MptE-like protein [Acetobacterium wieringae]